MPTGPKNSSWCASVLGRDVGEHRGREVRAVALAAGDQPRALLDGAVELVLQPLGGGERRQRAERGVGRGRVAGRVLRQPGGELLEERLVQVVHHDEALGRVARLTAVVEACADRGLDRAIQVIGAEQDERVRPAELEHDLLEVTCPRAAATAAPAASEPVSETPCTRGSAMTDSICELDA